MLVSNISSTGLTWALVTLFSPDELLQFTWVKTATRHTVTVTAVRLSIVLSQSEDLNTTRRRVEPLWTLWAVNWEKTDPAEVCRSAAGVTSVFTYAMTHAVTWRRDHITWLGPQRFHNFCLEIKVQLFFLPLSFVQNELMKDFFILN